MKIVNLIKKFNINRERLIVTRQVSFQVINRLNTRINCPCAGGCKGFCIYNKSEYKTDARSIPKESFFNLFHLKADVSRISGIDCLGNDNFYLVMRYNKCYMVKISPTLKIKKI